MALEVVLIDAAIFGVPALVGVAWWLRLRSMDVARWRNVVFQIGLLCVSLNALVYYVWFIYFNAVDKSQKIVNLKGVFADNIGFYCVLIGIICALFGRGAVRVVVALCAVLEILLLMNVGIL